MQSFLDITTMPLTEIWPKTFVVDNDEPTLHLALRDKSNDLDRTLRAVYINLESSESEISRPFPRLEDPAKQSLRISRPTHGSFYCIVTSTDDVDKIKTVEHENGGRLLKRSTIFEHNGLNIFAVLFVDANLLKPESNYLIECSTSNDEWEELVSVLSGDFKPEERVQMLKDFVQMDNTPLTMDDTFFLKAVPGHVYLVTSSSLCALLNKAGFERSEIGIIESDERIFYETIKRRKRLHASRVKEDVIQRVPMGLETSMIRWSVTCAKCEQTSKTSFGISQLAQHYAIAHDNARPNSIKYRGAFASVLLNHQCDVAIDSSERMLKA